MLSKCPAPLPKPELITSVEQRAENTRRGGLGRRGGFGAARLTDDGAAVRRLRDDVHVGRGIRRGDRQAAEGVLVG